MFVLVDESFPTDTTFNLSTRLLMSIIPMGIIWNHQLTLSCMSVLSCIQLHDGVSYYNLIINNGFLYHWKQTAVGHSHMCRARSFWCHLGSLQSHVGWSREFLLNGDWLITNAKRNHVIIRRAKRGKLTSFDFLIWLLTSRSLWFQVSRFFPDSDGPDFDSQNFRHLPRGCIWK